MVRVLLKKYRRLGWDVGRLRAKKRYFLYRMGYDLNKLMILNWMLGRLNMAGHKSWGFSILTNVLLSLKKFKNSRPHRLFRYIMSKRKQNILLFNKRKGSLVYELPRFLTIEQSIKRIIEWLIKAALKNKTNIIKSLIIEIQNMSYKKGEVWQKKKYISDTIRRNKPFFYLLKKKKKK